MGTARFDDIGLFWEATALPPIPDTGWKPPAVFPNLKHAKRIALDVETYDPELKTSGPGWARGVGHLVGVSLSVDRQNSWYFPIAHTIQPEYNLNPDNVLSYLQDTLSTDTVKIGANLQYDVGWLNHSGVAVGGLLLDVQYAEALLDDTARSYSLEAIAKQHLGEGKVDNLLTDWCVQAYGAGADQRKNIHRAPTSIVGPYAEADAYLTLDIIDKQWGKLSDYNLTELFIMECKLIRVWLGMRFRGLPINLEAAHQAQSNLILMEEQLQDTLNLTAGFDVNVRSPAHLEKLFGDIGLSFPKTTKGNPSFTKDWLSQNLNPVAKQVNNIRKINKARVTFVEKAILNKQINNTIYPSFHPLRGELGGAVSGRLSSSNPNAQQFPSRDKDLAPIIRSLFIPEPGYPEWLQLDASQIEYRYFAHFSGSERLIKRYQDKTTDFHAVVSAFLKDKLPRKPIKNFNFMSLFGGGLKRTEEMLQLELTQGEIHDVLNTFGVTGDYATLADIFVEQYSKNFPEAKATLKHYASLAARDGSTRTILGRRNTFDLWEPSKYGEYRTPLTYDEALDKYGYNIKRSATYKALNRILQGSAADHLKKGMLDAYEAGIFNSNRLGFPHVTVHDEIDFSYHQDFQRDLQELKSIMENAIPLRVPVIMNASIGADWGHC